MHVWLRTEHRPDELRTPLVPSAARVLLARGHKVTVEHSDQRCIATDDYYKVGCEIVPEGTWGIAPKTALILGLQQVGTLPWELSHRHMLLGPACGAQDTFVDFLDRCEAGGGVFLDLGLITTGQCNDPTPFGYWTGFVGMAATLILWKSQALGDRMPRLTPWRDRMDVLSDARTAPMPNVRRRPRVVILGPKNDIASGVASVCAALSIPTISWDLKQISEVDPRPTILAHPILVMASRGPPESDFDLRPQSLHQPRGLSLVTDLTCDGEPLAPPLPFYDGCTSLDDPVVRVVERPALDVVRVPHLATLLPTLASEDFSEQLLPTLLELGKNSFGPWAAAEARFRSRSDRVA